MGVYVTFFKQKSYSLVWRSLCEYDVSFTIINCFELDFFKVIIKLYEYNAYQIMINFTDELGPKGLTPRLDPTNRTQPTPNNDPWFPNATKGIWSQSLDIVLPRLGDWIYLIIWAVKVIINVIDWQNFRNLFS